jgi:hypothetical protein
MQRHGIGSKIDTRRFLHGLLTENEFWKNFKPESCRPYTTHAFDHASKAKDEWDVCVGYTLNVVSWHPQSTWRDSAFGGEMMDNQFRKNPSQNLVEHVLVLPLAMPWRQKMNGMYGLDIL